MATINKSFKIRDLRKKEQFIVDDAYLNGYAKHCGIYATGVYISLCRHVDKKQGCWPSRVKIAEELNISVKQVDRSIKTLIKHKIIKKVRPGKKLNNFYYLLDKSEWTISPLTQESELPPQSTHIATNSPLHSKDAHIKDAHRSSSLPPPSENLPHPAKIEKRKEEDFEN